MAEMTAYTDSKGHISLKGEEKRILAHYDVKVTLPNFYTDFDRVAVFLGRCRAERNDEKVS